MAVTIWPGTAKIDPFTGQITHRYSAINCQWKRVNESSSGRSYPASSPPVTKEPSRWGPKLCPLTKPHCFTIGGCWEGRIVVRHKDSAPQHYGPDTDPLLAGNYKRPSFRELAPLIANRLRNREAPALTYRVQSFAAELVDEREVKHICEELERALKEAGAPQFGIHWFPSWNQRSTTQEYQFRVFPIC